MTSCVDDGAEPVRRAVLARQRPRERQHPSQHAGVVQRRVGEGGEMPRRDQHEVQRRHRMDVVERDHVVVLVELLRRQLAARDLAENAVLHRGHPRSRSGLGAPAAAAPASRYRIRSPG